MSGNYLSNPKVYVEVWEWISYVQSIAYFDVSEKGFRVFSLTVIFSRPNVMCFYVQNSF